MRLAIALLFLLPQENPLADALKKVDEETLKAHEKVLASDEFEGRAAGFPGNDKAVEYIVKEVKEFGLKPAGEGDGYTQEFTVGKDRKCRNVIALLEGSDEKLKGEFVVIGAHLDHVGKKGQRVGGQDRSKAPEGDEIWNGADDNASGTSTVLAIAKAFAKGGLKPKRSVLFCWWNAEEAGLVGSATWCKNPTRPMEKVKFNLNMDMVGRNPERPVDLEGLKSSEGDAVAKIAKAACEAEKLAFTPYDFQNEAMFRSDGASFLRKSVPAIMFFTSWHDDYHRLGDHIDKIAYDRMAQIGRAAARILLEVANLDAVPAFNKETPLGGGGGGGRMLGIQGEELDEKARAEAKLDEGTGGYKLTEITAGSVAEKCGLKADDVIVGFGGKALPAKGTLDELRKRIRAAKDGEEVEVEILRGGERKTMKALWARK